MDYETLQKNIIRDQTISKIRIMTSLGVVNKVLLIKLKLKQIDLIKKKFI